MPYHKDFEELNLRGSYELEPEGWEPLIIEYGYEYIGNAQYFFWRVAETEHTFKLTVSSLNYESEGDYEQYIKKFLENFREEMLGWTLQGVKADWVSEYIREYNKWVRV